MLNQVGDTVQLSVGTFAGAGSIIYSYVWNFWDGSSTATVQPSVIKVINIGGNPANDNLVYSCRPVALDGQSTVIYGTLTANNPPLILPGASVSQNDGYFPFSAAVAITALDYEGDAIAYAWYEGPLFLGSGSTTLAGTAHGTWAGNGSVAITACAAYQNTFLASVVSDRVITCYVKDNRGGTTSLDFSLRGQNPPTPTASVSASPLGVSFDASTLPTALIGPGQTVDFTVYANPLPNTLLSFSWDFSGSNGWSMAPTSSAGVTTNLANGGYQNTVSRDISGETILTGVSKAVTTDIHISAFNYATNQTTHTDLQTSIVLVQNLPPSGVTVARSVAGVPVAGVGPITPGALLEFAATGTDSNSELLTYRWQFAQPFPPLNVFYHGPKVVYDTGGYSGTNQLVQGQLTVTDRLGATLRVVLPPTSFT